MNTNKRIISRPLVIATSIFYFSAFIFSSDLFADDTPGHVHEAAQTIESNEQPAAAMDSMQHDHAAMGQAMPSGNSMESMEHDHAAMGHIMPDAIESAATELTTDTAGLPEANPTETVNLKDGDTYEVTASYVKKQVGNRILRMLAYNGSVPGPFIKADQNSEITINFKNNTDIEQTIHSHGVRVDNRSDGVPGVTQNSVAPGASFTYSVKFQDAGVFWYHPHTRDDYGQELGLYGNYLIEPSVAGYWNPVNREVPLIIDDILIEDDRIASFYQEFTNYALLGRFGNEFLVNGQDDYSLKVKKGEVIRFFITNVSNARTYNLSIPNVQTKIVGADLGKYEHEMFADNFLISPAERIVVEAYFREPGDYQLMHTQPDGKVILTSIAVTADEEVSTRFTNSFAVLRHNYDVETEFRDFRQYLNKEPEKKLLLTIDLAGQDVDHSQHTHMHTEEELHDHSQHVMNAVEDRSQYQPMTPTEESLNTIQWSDPEQTDRTHRTPEIFWKLVDEETGKVSMDIDDWVFKVDDLVKIRLTNDENADHIMQHPVHFHGQQFVVLSVDDLPNNNLAWKDTVLVFPGQTMEILAKMSNPGEWMAHCHISEHLHAGMMLKFRVEDENGYATGDEYRNLAGNAAQYHNH